MAGGVYKPWRPRTVRIAGAHPAPLVQSAAMAAVAPPAPSYRVPEPGSDRRQAQMGQHPVGRVEPGRTPALESGDEPRVPEGFQAEPPPARPLMLEMRLDGTAERCRGVRHGPAT